MRGRNPTHSFCHSCESRNPGSFSWQRQEKKKTLDSRSGSGMTDGRKDSAMRCRHYKDKSKDPGSPIKDVEDDKKESLELPHPAHFYEVAFEVEELRVGFADLVGKHDLGTEPEHGDRLPARHSDHGVGETVRPQPTDDLSDFQAVGSVTFAVTVCLSRQ